MGRTGSWLLRLHVRVPMAGLARHLVHVGDTALLVGAGGAVGGELIPSIVPTEAPRAGKAHKTTTCYA